MSLTRRNRNSLLTRITREGESHEDVSPCPHVPPSSCWPLVAWLNVRTGHDDPALIDSDRPTCRDQTVIGLVSPGQQPSDGAHGAKRRIAVNLVGDALRHSPRRTVFLSRLLPSGLGHTLTDGARHVLFMRSTSVDRRSVLHHLVADAA